MRREERGIASGFRYSCPKCKVQVARPKANNSSKMERSRIKMSLGAGKCKRMSQSQGMFCVIKHLTSMDKDFKLQSGAFVSDKR